MSAYAMTFYKHSWGYFFLIPFIDLDAFSGLTQSNWTYIIATGFIHTGIVYYLFLIVYAIYLQKPSQY